MHNFYKVRDTFEDTKNKINKEGFSDMAKMMFGKSAVEETNNKTNSKKLAIKGESVESQIDITLEEAFCGTEKKLAFRDSEGKLKNLVLKIPKGIRNGERIKLAGQGKPGQNGGEHGDLFIRVNLMKDNKFELIGNDICTKISIAPWEAAFGCNINVKGIDSSIPVGIPSGIQTGEKLRITNNGFWNEEGTRGDLLLDIQIVMPKKLTEGEKLLFRKLSEISDFNPRSE